MSTAYPPGSLELLVAALYPNTILQRQQPLLGGISARMTVLELQTPGQDIQRIIVRDFPTASQEHAGHMLGREFKTLQLAHRLALKVPPPLYLDASASLLGRPFLILGYVDGDINFAPKDLPAYLEQMAGQMAQIHNAAASQDTSFLPLAPPPGSVPSGVRAAGRWGTILQRMQQALAASAPAQANANTLLHGDYWPGNLLWRGERLTAVIDWEDAMNGDPLIDLARSRSEIAWIFGQQALASFTAHYQALSDLDYTNLPTWDLWAALRQLRLANGDFDKLASFFLPYRRPDLTGAGIEDNLLQFIEQALTRHQ